MRQEEVIKCSMSNTLVEVFQRLCDVANIPLNRLRENHVIHDRDIMRIPKFRVLQILQNYSTNPPPHFGRGTLATIQGDLGLLVGTGLLRVWRHRLRPNLS